MRHLQCFRELLALLPTPLLEEISDFAWEQMWYICVSDSFSCLYKVNDILSQQQFVFDETEIPPNYPQIFSRYYPCSIKVSGNHQFILLNFDM